MTQEALKLALEALQFALHIGFDESSESQIKKGDKAGQQHRKAITAIKEALAQPEQCQCPNCKVTFHASDCALHHQRHKGEHMSEQQMANYTLTIQADSGYKSTTEGRCTAEQYGQAIAALHGTFPAQRTWVGLTDDELLEIYGWRKAPMLSDFIVEEAKQELLGALRKVEAKLKEKNCG